MNKKLWIAAVACLPVLMATAQVQTTQARQTSQQDETTPKDQTTHQDQMSHQEMPEHATLFRAHEFSLDVFGTASLGESTLENFSWDAADDNAQYGVGVGVNYFFMRNLGLGVDAYTEDTDHSFVDNTSVNLILRFPFEKAHLAPYIYGGGGYQFDPTDTSFLQAGGGLEIRFTRCFGLFVDARYIFLNNNPDEAMARTGIRIVF